MHRLIQITLLSISLSLFVQAQASPLYYVDGVPSDSVPPSEAIERVTIVSAEGAVPIYGERASNGVVLITTKDYARKQQLAQSSSKKHHIAPRFGSGSAREVRGIFIGLAIVYMIFIRQIEAFLTQTLKRKKKKKQPTTLSHDSFDSREERFEASAYWGNYVMPILSIVGIIFMGIVLYRMTTGIVPETGNFLLGCIFTAVVDVILLILFIRSCKNMKSYLIVDEKGIRGIYKQESHRLFTKSVFKEVNITWEEIKRAEINGFTILFYKNGTRIPDDMVDFAELADLDMDEKEIEASIKELDLSLFPVQRVKNCINYFYDRYSTSQASEHKKTLIRSSDETSSLVVWIVVIGLLIIAFFIAFKIT